METENGPLFFNLAVRKGVSGTTGQFARRRTLHDTPDGWPLSIWMPVWSPADALRNLASSSLQKGSPRTFPEKVCLRVQSERLVAVVAVFESRLLELVEPDPEFPALGRIHIGTIIASILSGTGRDLGKILSVIATGVRNIWSPRAPGGRGTRVGTTCCAHFKRD